MNDPICQGSICTDGKYNNIFKYEICKNTRNCGTTKYEIPGDSYLDVIIDLPTDEVCKYTFNVSENQFLTFRNHGDSIPNMMVIRYDQNHFQTTDNIFNFSKFDTSKFENLT